MEKKVYYNQNLEKMLNRYIKQEKYGGFKLLLDEIFQRRAYEFQFNEKHMKKEIKNFVKRVERIDFGKNISGMPKNMYGMSRYMLGKRGEYLRGWIYFNCDSYYITDNLLSDLDLYCVLTHEVYHKISEIGNGRITALANCNTGEGISSNEIINETAATRTTFSRNETDNENFRQETSAYDLITFVANLLATSFGIEERELLKAGLQNRKEFKKVCKKYISKQDYRNDISFHYDILETNLDFLYNTLYVEEKNPNDPKIIASSFEEICCQIFNIANTRIEKGARKINSEYAGELAYDFQKSRKIIEHSLLKLKDRDKITESTMTEVIQNIYSSEAYLNFLNKVSDIIVLTNQKSQIKDQAIWQEMEQLAKEGKLINHAEEFGMEDVNNLSREQWIEYHQKNNHEFNNPTQWDNDYVTKIMEQLWNEREIVDVAKLEEELIIANNKTKLEKVKDFFVQFKNRKLKRLESSEREVKQEYQELKNDVDERYKVPEEKLKPIEKQNTHKSEKKKEKEK